MTKQNTRTEEATFDDVSGVPAHTIEGAGGLDRRQFLGAVGASAAVTGASLSGCIRKPVQKIMPYARRPEDLIPGKPLYFATAMQVGGAVQGLIVESQEGRPTKIDGNPRHAGNKGSTDVWAQSAIYDLYDGDRAQTPSTSKGATDWASADSMLSQLAQRIEDDQGKGLAILLQASPSPSFQAVLGRLRALRPEVAVYRHDQLAMAGSLEGLALVGAAGRVPRADLSKADVILTVDADPLHMEGDVVRNDRDFGLGRKLKGPKDSMNRLYAVEGRFTNTGASADHRLRLRTDRHGGFLAQLANTLVLKGASLPSNARIPATDWSPDAGQQAWIDAVADDLLARRGRALVLVGERHAGAHHALGHLINAMLGSVGVTMTYPQDRDTPDVASIADLATDILDGKVTRLVVLGGNPAYEAPGDLDFERLLARVPMSIVLSEVKQESGVAATWHLPQAHFLESWGDLQDSDGSVSIQQPLIAPLYPGAMTANELVARLTGDSRNAHTIVKDHWAQRSGQVDASLTDAVDQARERASASEAALSAVNDELDAARTAAAAEGAEASAAERVATLTLSSQNAEKALSAARAQVAVAAEALAEAQSSQGPAFERRWRQWLHDGITDAEGTAPPAVTLDWSSLPSSFSAADGDGLLIDFSLDTRVGDGRFANNAWLQELPDFVSKLTWDNAALLSGATAEKLGVTAGDMLRVDVNGRHLEIPAWPTVGVADDTLVLPLGYGRRAGGRVANGIGFDVNAIRNAESTSWVTGANAVVITATGSATTPQNYPLATTQEYGFQSVPGAPLSEKRPLARSATKEEYEARPDFVQDGEVMAAENLKSLWTEPNKRDGQQWGMSIDLNACTGCGACTMACNVENNVPVVGKTEVLNGREMHWLRIDRYFQGPDDAPDVIAQPVGCVQCETAPCEQVCPVAATTHSPDGLNDMAYNRCIGTRYCANNCPIKVRRFNFFNYTKRSDEMLGETSYMQRNPDVTVRFRGVMEKCSYCVQRINEARIESKRDGDGTIPDGAVVPACAQVCPSEAIVFGDINDPESKVSRVKANDRDYGMLEELNIHPRTTYLGRVTNPNPRLKS